MAGRYAAQVIELLDRYSDRIRPTLVRSLREKCVVGEWALVANDLAWALVATGIAVTAEDKASFRDLLSAITLPPDTPPDLANQLLVDSSPQL
ncbi:hypothetical protein ACFVMC_16535 [Nocardia sp. NPDC127579]|uniref:hypothetical protein n=1 Tax=Nocardia sp. NPDC127579 TaxID=3345402 RepID=UPI003626362B